MKKSAGKNSVQFFVIAHNIRSAHNVGSIFRTADAVGATKIYLTGYTPRPFDQFGRVNKEIAKTALGAEKTVPWEYQESISRLLSKLKKQQVQIIALEQNPHSVDYKKAKINFPCVLLLGEEVGGVAPALLKKCDLIVEIPMRGEKESLNVSVAFGVATFRLLGI